VVATSLCFLATNKVYIVTFFKATALTCDADTVAVSQLSQTVVSAFSSEVLEARQGYDGYLVCWLWPWIMDGFIPGEKARVLHDV
jgi:hypothetical protein